MLIQTNVYEKGFVSTSETRPERQVVNLVQPCYIIVNTILNIYTQSPWAQFLMYGRWSCCAASWSLAMLKFLNRVVDKFCESLKDHSVVQGGSPLNYREKLPRSWHKASEIFGSITTSWDDFFRIFSKSSVIPSGYQGRKNNEVIWDISENRRAFCFPRCPHRFLHSISIPPNTLGILLGVFTSSLYETSPNERCGQLWRQENCRPRQAAFTKTID
jgi:hypothetical protein